MNRLRIAALCLFLAAGCSSESGTAGADMGAEVSFITGMNLIPGDGSAPIEDAMMIVENGIIKEIGGKGELTAPKGSVRIAFEGHTVMPLLVNIHAYPGLSNAGSFGADNYKRDSLMADLSRYTYYGVGTVLAFGTDSKDLALQVRDEQRAGPSQQAHLYTSGRGISGRGGVSSLGDMPIQVNSEAEARSAVGELADKKVDVITIWAADSLRPEAYSAVIDEAHKRNLKVFADAPNLANAKGLVAAGVDGLVSSIRDRAVDDELISMMKEKNVFLAPALSALEARFVIVEQPAWIKEQAFREVYPAKLSAYLENTVTVNRIRRDPQTAVFRQQYPTAVANLKKLADAGVKIAFGSGSGSTDTFPGYFEHRELELMVKAGLTPEAALRTSIVSAEALGDTTAGTLTPGKRGDFFVLSESPLTNIETSRSIDDIYLGGKQVDRLELIRNIVIDVPEITAKDRAADAEQQRLEAQAAADARLPHFGKFPAGSSVSRDGIAIPTPKYSRTEVTNGPPLRITVSLANASAADIRGFYAAALVPRWTAAGNCWERPHPVQEGKRARLCAEPSGNSLVLNITVQ